MSKQIFISYLQRAVDGGLILCREAGRATYYKLSLTTKEEEFFDGLLTQVQAKLKYTPDSIKLS